MDFQTIFKKRIYEYLYYKYYPFYTSSQKDSQTNSPQISLAETVKKAIPEGTKSLVLVAAGPSSKNLPLRDDELYFCTNNSIKLVHKKNFVYYIQDYFFTLRYIKMFFNEPNWRGTFCIVNDNGYKVNTDVFRTLTKYLGKHKRNRGEYLLSDIYNQSPHVELFKELNTFLKAEFDCEFVSLNSGYSMLMLVSYFSKISGLPIKIYGLDLGEGGSVYFDGSKIDMHCSYADRNKEPVYKLLVQLYENYSVQNFSNFMKNVE